MNTTETATETVENVESVAAKPDYSHFYHLLDSGYKFKSETGKVTVKNRKREDVTVERRRWYIMVGGRRQAGTYPTRKAAVAKAKEDCPLPAAE